MLKKKKINRYENLYKYAERFKPKSMLEIGVWDAVHAVRTLQVMKRFHKNLVYHGCDVFEMLSQEEQKKECAKEGRYFTEQYCRKKIASVQGVEITLHKGYTRDTLPSIGRTFDYVLIDGGHSIETIEQDWQNVQKLIHKTSYIIFDDYYFDRNDIGCKTIIDNLPENFTKKVLQPIDSYEKEHYVQYTQMVLVMPN